MDPSTTGGGGPRILEISQFPLVKCRYPAETTLVNTEFSTVPGQGLAAKIRLVAGRAAQLWQAAFGPVRYGLVVCRCLGRFIYRQDLSWPVNALRWVMGHFINLCVWRQLARGARLAVVDLHDEATIDRRDLFLLRRCELYFKRELPQNAWDALLRVQPPHGEFFHLVSDARSRALVARMRPFSLGLTGLALGRLAEFRAGPLPPLPEAADKTCDVFYAGLVGHSTVRTRGFPLLEEMARRGLRVEAVEGRLPYEEFMRRLRGAWLVWSPAGQGWDCYRHYEVCLGGSVPVISQPTTERYQPLVDGVHCFYYYSEGDDLCRRVEAALADKAALLRMAAAAREHTLKHYLPEALGEHIVRQMEAGAGGQAGSSAGA